MPWIAPSEKDTANGTPEKRPWDFTDQLRELQPQVPGILRARVRAHLPALGRRPRSKTSRLLGRGNREETKPRFQRDLILYRGTRHLEFAELQSELKTLNELI